MALGNRLKQARELSGETLRQVGEAVAMDATHLSRIERGIQTCGDEKKLALARHFGLPVDRLFFQEVVESASTGVA